MFYALWVHSVPKSLSIGKLWLVRMVPYVSFFAVSCALQGFSPLRKFSVKSSSGFPVFWTILAALWSGNPNSPFVLIDPQFQNKTGKAVTVPNSLRFRDHDMIFLPWFGKTPQPQRAPNPPEFAQLRLSSVKARSSPARGYKFGCVCSYMAGHEDAGVVTGQRGTNTPKFVPPRWGRPRFEPYSNGAVQIRVGLELADNLLEFS